MNDYIYHNTTKIIFGRSAEKYIGSECKALADGGKVLLLLGGGSAKKSGLYDKVVASLNESGVEFTELWGVQPNPRIDKVREAAMTAKRENVSLILAVGGGSVIDTAKAAAAGALYDGDPWDFYSGAAKPVKALPLGVVLTIPAAGSESSMASVISNPETNEKIGCSAECYLPRFAVMNPENTYTLPPYQTACGASDMLAHLMERYFVNAKCCDLTDRLIEGAAQTVIRFAPLALESPEDYDIRAELMQTGCIAHNNLLDCGRGEDIGRGGDWASHQLEHQLSAYYDIAHGAGLSIIFPAWMKFVRKSNPAKLEQFGRRVFHLEGSGDEVIDMMISELEKFFRFIGMPTCLSDINIGCEHFREMAENAVRIKHNKLGSYVRLTADDAEEIYRLAQ